MLEVIIENHKPIGKILLIMLVSLLITVAIFFKKIKGYILENWNTLRNNPMIIPFAGFIKKDKNKSSLEATKDNFIAVLKGIVDRFFALLMTPIYPIIKFVLNIMKSLVGVLNKIRGQITVIRNLLFKIFEKMYIRLQNGLAAITFFFLKLREGMKRSFGLFNLVLYSIEHSYMFFRSMMGSPLGEFGKIADGLGFGLAIFTHGPFGPVTWRNAFCFNPETKIRLYNHELEALKNLRLGYILKDGSLVLATIDINVEDKSIYEINNIEVTGNHFIKYKNRWIRVSNHPDARMKEYSDNKVRCLVTTTGLINIEDCIFRDYLDSHDLNVNNKIRRIVDSSLNPDGIDKVLDNKKCDNIMTGYYSKDDPEDSIGLVRIREEILDMYTIGNNVVSGNIIVKYGKNWIRALNHPEAKYIGKNLQKCKHYITESGIINLDNLVIRDFNENDNHKVNKNILDIVEESLNK